MFLVHITQVTHFFAYLIGFLIFYIYFYRIIQKLYTNIQTVWNTKKIPLII